MRSITHDASTALVLIQLQGPFGGQHQRLQGTSQLRLAIKEAINDDFPIVTCQHTTQLASSAVALFSKVAFGGKGRLRAAGQAALKNRLYRFYLFNEPFVENGGR